MGETPSGDSLDNSTRRSFLLAAGGAGMVALAGCSGDEDLDDEEGDPLDDSGDDGTGDSGQDVLDLSIAPTDSFDNIRTKGDGSEAITDQIYAGLMTHPPGQLEPEGELAESVDVSDDFLTYTFTLREDLTFHNGDPVRAQDFVYSWERLAASPNTQEARHITTDVPVAHEVTADSPDDATYPDDYVEGSLAVEALDDRTLEVQLRRQWHSVLEKLTVGEVEPIPEGHVDDVPGYDGDVEFEEFESSPPPGAGPFEFVEFDRGSRARLEAFDNYYGEGPHVDAIEMTVVDDEESRYQRALGGQVDIFNIPEVQYDQNAAVIDREGEFGAREGSYTLENGEEVNYGEWQNVDTRYLVCNAQRVPKYVRQAIALTVNQHQLVEEAFAGLGQPAYMYTPPTVFPGGAQAYVEKAREEYPYGYDERRPGEAQQLMEENGHDEDNPYELTYTHHSDRQVTENEIQAGIIRDQLQAVHIDVSIEQVPFSTIIDRAIDGELDIFTLGNSIDFPEAEDTLQYAWPSDGNFSNWFDTPATERATDAWNRVIENGGPSDEETQIRNEAYIDIEEASWEDIPDINLRHPVETIYWADNVEHEVPTSAFHRQQYNRVRLD